ncbi:hypothetical protein L9F63_026838, partial [Diploptera punctata]
DEEFKVPSWLNCKFLSEILSKEDLEIRVTEFDVKPAVDKGDNYLSTLYRVVVKCTVNKETNEIETFNLIIKTLPEGEMVQKILQQLKGFEKEFHIYEVVFPALNLLLTKSVKGEFQQFSPKFVSCTNENIIVMEDLKQHGYKMAVRHVGLDLNHCKTALKMLARFHATSYAVHKSDPSSMDIFVEEMYKDTEENRKHMQPYFNSNLSSLASKVETWEGYERFASKLRQLIPCAMDKMVEAVTPKKDSFNVLNHGDFWVNNMLFHYNPDTDEVDDVSGKVEDVRLLDFQLSRYSSPALDLQYFMCNCPNDEVRFQHRDSLLEEYYSELADYCKSMGLESELISFKQLKEEFEEKNFFGLITACTVLRLMLAEKEDVPDLKNVTEDNFEDINTNFAKNTISRKKYREIFQKVLLNH